MQEEGGIAQGERTWYKNNLKDVLEKVGEEVGGMSCSSDDSSTNSSSD